MLKGSFLGMKLRSRKSKNYSKIKIFQFWVLIKSSNSKFNLLGIKRLKKYNTLYIYNFYIFNFYVY
jgi:hypothetical protein